MVPSGSTPSQRGELVREVRGTGTLVPVDTAWIPATTDGRVARILLRPGAQVEPDDVILELHNPALAQEVVDTRLQLQAAEARLKKADADATTALLAQEALVAATEAKYEEARSDAEADSALLGDGLVSELQHRRSAALAKSLPLQVAAERKRLDVGSGMRPSQIAEQQAEVARMHALLALKSEQFAAVAVRAGMPACSRPCRWKSAARWRRAPTWRGWPTRRSSRRRYACRRRRPATCRSGRPPASTRGTAWPKAASRASIPRR